MTTTTTATAAAATVAAATVAAATVAADTPTDAWTEIEAISNQVRRAIECPICLMMSPDMSCLCPNKHPMCYGCMVELQERDPALKCPMCRSPLMDDSDASSAMVDKVAQVLASVKLACVNRNFGCKGLFFVRDITVHEQECAYKPDICCLASGCQWLGVYDQLHAHVMRAHPKIFRETTKNNLYVHNVNMIAANQRETYLVRSPNGMFWVVLSRMARSRIRAGMFIVKTGKSMELANTPDTADVAQTPLPGPATSQFSYRVSWIEQDGKSGTRCRTKSVGLSSSFNKDLRGSIDGAADSYTVIRSSVVGLNFDFIALNLVGFILYSMFNIGLWLPEIEQEYLYRNPRGHNPVQLNDIFFSTHAVFATLITVFQCYFYERGEQQVSRTAKSILSFYSLILAALLVLVYLNKIVWLDFLYYCSYIKLTITLIKYIPQAVMNYKRKSTIGWSIGNIFLDFTGGVLSILQMIINAYNYNDWASVFGDPTKFGLGVLSIVFDVLFFLQHYVFYSGIAYAEIENPTNVVEVEENEVNNSAEHTKLTDKSDGQTC